jgi:hypothetical protein
MIVSSMVLHHIPDVPETVRRLRPCLRPNGWIALADLDSEDGTFHPDPTGVCHHGLDRNEVCRWLQDAGFGECPEQTSIASASKGFFVNWTVYILKCRLNAPPAEPGRRMQFANRRLQIRPPFRLNERW